MKNIPKLDVKRESAPNKQKRKDVEIVKIKKAFSKAARQEAFIESVANLPMNEAVSRAKLIADVNPSDFRIVRMPG
jgi:hypothetical protein